MKRDLHEEFFSVAKELVQDYFVQLCGLEDASNEDIVMLIGILDTVKSMVTNMYWEWLQKNESSNKDNESTCS